MPPAELSRAVYCGVLRWARAAEGVPFSLYADDVKAVLPTLNGLADLDLKDSAAVRRLLRCGFSCNRELQDELEASEALERALHGLRLLNSRYQDHVEWLRSEHAAHCVRPASVHFHIGQVIEHRHFGYKGVINGWDARCAKEPGWAEALRLDPDQPFYSVLPDELDCQRAFGQTRFSKYVAQENVRPLSHPQRIANRVLQYHFSGYSPSSSRYVPIRMLAFRFPDCYAAGDVVSCLEDSDVLRLDDLEEEEDDLGSESSNEGSDEDSD